MEINREKLIGMLSKVFPFNHLNGEQLSEVAKPAELVYFSSGKMIYIENAKAEAFYVLLEGKVEILQERKHLLHGKNLINPYFGFGEDVFSSIGIRRTSSRAVEDSVLIKIPVFILENYLDGFSGFSKGISRICDSYQFLTSNTLETQAEETIAFVSHTYPIALVIKIIGILVAILGVGICTGLFYSNQYFSSSVFTWIAVIISLSGLGWMVWSFFEWQNDYFVFTDKRIRCVKRSNLVFEELQETPLSSIESIQIRRNFLGRMLNFGDLEVKTFTGSARVSGVSHIQQIQDILHFLASRRKQVEDQEELDTFQEAIRGRINQDSEETLSESEIQILDEKDISKEIEIQESEEFPDSSYIFRTHWTILFSKVFIPGLLFLSHVFLWIFLKGNRFTITENSIFTGLIVGNSILLFGWAAYRFIDWRNDLFIITDTSLIDVDKHPFGMEEKRSAPLKRIQSIRYQKNGIFGMLLNFGTVFIRIGDDEFTFNNVHRPSDVQDQIFAARDHIFAQEELIRKNEGRKRAVDWFDTYHQIIKEENNKNSTPPKNQR